MERGRVERGKREGGGKKEEEEEDEDGKRARKERT